MPRFSLRTKLLIGFLFVLLPILALIIYDYRAGYDQLSEGILDDQMRTSQAIAALVDASIDDALSIAQSLSQDPILQTMDPLQMDPHLASLKPSLPQFDDMGVVDLEGKNVGLMSQLAPDVPRPSAAGRAYFEAVKSTRQPAVSDVLISRSTGNPIVAVAAPLFDSSGTMQGVTIVALDLDYLVQRVGTVGLRKSQAIFVTDPEGTIVLHTLLAREEWGRRSLSDYPPVQSALSGVPGREREIMSLLGDVRMVATVGTAKYGWVVGVSLSRAEALQPVQDDLARRLLLFSGVLVFAGLVAVMLSQYMILGPLGVLRDHLTAFGRGQLRRLVSLRTGDELEDLADAFNRMTESLSDKEAQLRGHAARLEQVNKELEAFSYSVSHDLRAPLRGIDGFSQALLEDYADSLDDQGKDYLQRVRAASQRMAQLIDDMLKLSRVTRAEMRHETVDLSALAHDIAGELQKTRPERQVDFVIAPGLVVNGDAQLLRAVLENLLGNAWKFTSAHPCAKIEFGIAEYEGKPAYFVRDDGVGFDMAYVDKLFGAFQRLHAMNEFPGTGIGLATVQRIIHRHGGHVWAEGAVEQGATFYFTL